MADAVDSGTEQPDLQVEAPSGKDALRVTPEDFTDKKSTKAKSENSQDESQPRKSEAKDKNPGPWAKKLADLGLDDPRFDDFLRDEVQPYVTRLEQGRGESLWEANPDDEQHAFDLLSALREDPATTMQQLAEVLGFVEQSDDESLYPGQDPQFADDYQDEEAQAPVDDPYRDWVAQQIQREQQEQADQQYAQHIEMLEQRVPGFNPELYSMAYIANDGSLEDAWTAYMQFHRDPDPTDDAPPQLGGPAGSSAPPEEPSYSSIGDAMNSFLAEETAAKRR